MKKFSLSSSKVMNAKLALMGIFTYEDVLYHLPARYESYLYTKEKTIYEDKERLVILGKIEGNVKVSRFSSRSLTSFMFVSKEGSLFKIEAWNRPYLGKTLKNGEWYSLIGNYDKQRHTVVMVNILKGEIDKREALKPVYHLPSGIANHAFVSLVSRALIALRGNMKEKVPFFFRKKYNLDSVYESLRMLHQPESHDDLAKGIRTLKYLEALEFSLKTQIVREENRQLVKGHRHLIDRNKLEVFIDKLPYSLTASQRTSLRECLDDMDSPSIMYRLLQGDVGSGKTMVAALAAYACVTRGEQAALMAPTDALAKQHFETFKELFKDTKVSIGLLTGSMDHMEKRNTLADLNDGTLDIVIGTHALFTKSVNYNLLGLAIIDEQHKFGVNQRTTLLDKGENADLLLMSATPIPRTLALTVYGDLDVSTLDEFPAGKRSVSTRIMSPRDKGIGEYVNNTLNSGHRMYVVVPKIEGDDDPYTSVKRVYQMYEKHYPNKVSLLHGSLSQEDKDVANIAFRTGLCPILVATSLIEVGIDVKPANLMLIYSPTHFSLSSLHQLRGRIGRDGSEANCLLLFDETDNMEKLQVLVNTDDGFKIAEADLKMRGPGEIAGTRQSGLPNFLYANLINDFKLFEHARDDAKYIIKYRKDDEEFEEFYVRLEKESKDISIG